MLYIHNKETAERLLSLGCSYMLSQINGHTVYVFNDSDTEIFKQEFANSLLGEDYLILDKLLF